MKTLKKVLSLVLVVAMIASMLIVGAAAATEEETQYDEAVSVVTGIGIIEGDENGYNFKGGVTREQAAKIIAYLLLGKETAESLKTTTAPFADVAANRWSAGYVAYLKGQGIISGVSDTEFDPTAPVTGIAFAKMLLTAVGYGKAGEFEGKDWDINTITFANDNGVFTDTLAADIAAGATREEAMLYAFNVLTKVPVVKYNKTFESYYVGPSALDPVETDDFDPADEDTAYGYTLAWTKYELKQTTTGTDDFGRPAASWTADGVVVAEAVATERPDAVFKGTVQSYLLYPALGKTVVNYLNSHWENVTQYIDGVLQGTGDPFVTESPITENIVAGEFTNTIGGYGATVELYLTQNDGDYRLRVVTINEYIGEVRRVTTTGTPTLSIVGETAEADGEEIDITGYAKGDLVLYTKGADGITSLKPAEYVTGTYTASNFLFGTYTLDGVTYYASAKNDNVGATLAANYGNTYDLYLDSQGNIIYAELAAEGESANQYLYVKLAEAQPHVEGALKGQVAKVALTVVYPQGGTEVVYHAVKSVKIEGTTYYYISVGTTNYAIVGDAEAPKLQVLTKNPLSGAYTLEGEPTAAEEVLTGWYRYATNENGAVTLNVLNSSYAKVENVTLSTGKATIGVAGYTANSATTLTKVDAFGNVVTYTGINNFVDVSPASALITYGFDSKVVKSITLYVESISSSMNIAYCAGSGDATAEGTPYMFYIDGALQIITTADTVASTGKIYDIQVNDGVYTFTEIDAYENSDGEIFTDKGVVNAGYAYKDGADGDPYIFNAFGGKDPQTPTKDTYYGVQNMKNFAYSYYEWATVDYVDDNFFTTVAVELVDVPDEVKDGETVTNQDAIDAANARNAVILEESVAGIEVESSTYYFDGNTEIYDCTMFGGGKAVDSISEGDVFIAFVDEEASAAYLGEMYVSHIWIVG